jgi:dienelactone hydrolase/DNA-directed RNA polymerase subunit RPC12/RpoP
MSISFACPNCGKKYETGDQTAGLIARCKDCGQRMRIPSPQPAVATAELDEDVEQPPVLIPVTPTQTHIDRWTERYKDRPRPVSRESSSGLNMVGKVAVVGAIAFCMIAVIVIGLASVTVDHKDVNWNPTPSPSPVGGPPPSFSPVPIKAPSGPIIVPRLPELPPGAEYEPGVTVHEVWLPGGPLAGFSGRLWLYLPTGAKKPNSLPCVMIAPAGSSLITGKQLAEEDRPEHLPYVRQGFAVLAFELDGAIDDDHIHDARALSAAVPQFLAARAGLVNAHIALRFLLAKVPQVDPERIYVAGHDSAATFAILFAEDEPRIKGCVAYAPVIDLARQIDPRDAAQLKRIGYSELIANYSPKSHDSELDCPIFLFQSQADQRVSLEELEAFAERLEELDKDVALKTVPKGDHYQSMIDHGIPSGIKWLKELDSASR